MHRIRFALVFAAGVIAAVTALTVPGGVGTFAATRYEDLSLFSEVLNLVRRNYVEPVDESVLIRGAVKGMLQELDPHSSYLDPEVYKEMQIDTRGQFAGLGIEIAKRQDGYVEVVSPIEGTPADRAGIQARDQIVSICPTDPPEDWKEPCHGTKNMTLIEAVRLMRGPKGTKITIQIYRDGFDRPQPYSIMRDVVKVQSVSGRFLESGYGYVRIRAFQERTGRDLHRELKTLEDEYEGDLKGLVLDLRDNPGGLLDQAVKVADTWLGEGLIVYTRGRVESQRQEFAAHEAGTEPSYPMVVLVNGGSASASEIVAGALQDHDRALVLGTQSFGKGSVQTIIPLNDGSGLRITTALYYTPADRSIQEVGIAPDIVVDPTPPVQETQAQRRRRVREADLEGHFTQEDAVPEAGTESEVEEEPSAGVPDDMQLGRALEVLKSWTYFERLNEGRKAAAADPATLTP